MESLFVISIIGAVTTTSRTVRPRAWQPRTMGAAAINAIKAGGNKKTRRELLIGIASEASWLAEWSLNVLSLAEAKVDQWSKWIKV